MNIAQLLADLADIRAPISELAAPGLPGVYAVFLIQRGALPGIECDADGLLYIGTSSNLAQREFDTHFQAGKSGFSTLRRTLGALMIDDLKLHPQARGSGTSDTNFRNFRFDDEGEHRLSDWMRQHLQVAVQPLADPKDVEGRLIAHARPPLNLTKWANPDAGRIKAARNACVAAARRTDRQ